MELKELLGRRGCKFKVEEAVATAGCEGVGRGAYT